jgi:hypothetical protein
LARQAVNRGVVQKRTALRATILPSGSPKILEAAMAKYFIKSVSFAAPFFSDEDTTFVHADTPQEALELYAARYKHPAGLYAAHCYESADAYHEHKAPLAKWLCNHEIEKAALTASRGSYSYLGHAPGDFEIDGERHKIANPKQGRVIDDFDEILLRSESLLRP